jgi:hypothetical protein
LSEPRCPRRRISRDTQAHKLAEIVDAKSADPGVNATIPIPIDADHLNICKPSGRNSVIYLSITPTVTAMLCEWPSPSDGTERLLHFVRGQRHLAQTDPACIRYRVGKSGGRGALGGFAGAQKRETPSPRKFLTRGMSTPSCLCWHPAKVPSNC